MEEFYGTQGGGIAEMKSEKAYFIEPPNWGSFQVGDEVPEEWGLTGPFDLDGSLMEEEDD